MILLSTSLHLMRTEIIKIIIFKIFKYKSIIGYLYMKKKMKSSGSPRTT